MHSTASISTEKKNGSIDEFYKPKLFQGSGRLGRIRFLLYLMAMPIFPLLFTMASFLALAYQDIDTTIDLASNFATFSVCMGILSLVMTIVLCARRLNDFDFKGWWVLVSCIPIIGIILAIALVFVPGTSGSNRYGPPPVKDSYQVKALCAIAATFYLILASYELPFLNTMTAFFTVY